jgi:hypothetical protein
MLAAAVEEVTHRLLVPVELEEVGLVVKIPELLEVSIPVVAVVAEAKLGQL